MGMLHATSQHNDYKGPDRRRHRVFVTRNSEYHCRDGICVAVRNVTTGSFEPEHHALGKRVTSSIRFSKDGGIAAISTPDHTEIGEQLCFASATGRNLRDLNHEIITSAVEAIERPPKEIVAKYTH
jgi:hypothetical protein